MTDTTPTVPEWAKKRAKQLAAAEPNGVLWSEVSHNAFARYIAEHEKPPVDPLLIEAREIAARMARSEIPRIQYTNGFRDSDRETQIAFAALRRGIELAREQQP